jgi:hypothetical protein
VFNILNDIWAESFSSNSTLLYTDDSLTKELLGDVDDSSVGRSKLLVWYRHTRYLWNWNSSKNYSSKIMSAKNGGYTYFYGQAYVCSCIIM